MAESALELKQRVKAYWELEVCGSRYGPAGTQDRRSYFEELDRARYELEPEVIEFAQFGEARGKKVLEVGLGAGADFARWVRAGAQACGRDLTEASVNLVRERLELEGLPADVAMGDAEDLQEFADNSFDIFYSSGVLMATPDTEKGFSEAHRVLKPGGQLKVLIYHYPSVSAFLIWMLQGPLHFRMKSPRACVAEHYESPGMKMYTIEEARALVGKFFTRHPIDIRLYLGAGDLLTHKFSTKYAGRKWELARALYPRWFVRHVLGRRFGTGMLISTVK
ncbi:MAG: class I SAM-dependent methyltransferase [Candidatus Acidiferrales bacterium]